MPDYGLGCIPSPPDTRDYQLVSLIGEEVSGLPASFAIKPIPPNLDQDGTGMCAAYSTTAMKMWQERLDEGTWHEFDPRWLYARCKLIDGYPGVEGTTLRAAMRVLAGTGFPCATEPASAHKIKAYYRVSPTADAIKAALVKSGPVVVAMPWYRSWFRNRKSGILLAPDVNAGNHAVCVTGYEGPRGLLIRNSWGRDWGSLGNFWLPWKYVPRIFEAWRTVDL